MTEPESDQQTPPTDAEKHAAGSRFGWEPGQVRIIRRGNPADAEDSSTD